MTEFEWAETYARCYVCCKRHWAKEEDPSYKGDGRARIILRCLNCFDAGLLCTTECPIPADQYSGILDD